MGIAWACLWCWASTVSAVGDADDARRRLLVLDVKAAAEDVALGSVVTDVVAVESAADARFDVITSKDMRAFMEKEAGRAALGCDELANDCIAELAGALGASLVAYGEVSRLDRDTIVVTVHLFDADSARSVGRETFQVGSAGALPAATRKAMRKLLGHSDDDVPALVWSAGAVAMMGVAVAAIATGGAFTAYAVEVDPASSGDDKGSALAAHPWWSVVAAGAAGVAVVAAATAGVGWAVAP